MILYGGPGSVISGIGALLALVVALLASVVGFVWYPAKRAWKWLRKPSDDRQEGEDGNDHQ